MPNLLCCFVFKDFASVFNTDTIIVFQCTGACEGTLACSTCHLIFDQKFYDMIPKPSDEELDMLDLAYGLVDT